MAYAEKRGPYWRGRYRNPQASPPLGHRVGHPGRAALHHQDRGARRRRRQGSRPATPGRAMGGPPVDGATGVTLDQWKRLLAGRRRARGGRDPYAGEITFREWVETRWLPAQDIEDSSRAVYEQHLRLRIYPAFGDWPVNTLYDREQIQAWEISLRRRYSPNTVNNARDLLATILGDARDAGLVDDNAAARRRRRGRSPSGAPGPPARRGSGRRRCRRCCSPSGARS